jgi:acyl dehydratase
MSIPLHHVLSQGPMLGTLGRIALGSLRPRTSGKPPATPGPWLEAELPPRPDALLRAFVRDAGGDPGWYRGRVPASLFPQWGFPLAARTLAGLPYPMMRVINAGCRVEQRAPLPSGERLLVRARLESIDDDGARAILVQRVVTGTRTEPDAMVGEIRAFVPLAAPSQERTKKKTREVIPLDATELAFLRLSAGAGLDFAKLTGDFNPIHWLAPYARASGFRAPILHGFASFARALEALNRARFAGDVSRLATMEARFSRPLVLPARVGVYVQDGRIWIGDAPGGGAYLEGSYTTRS